MIDKINEGIEGFQNALQYLPSGWSSREIMSQFRGKVMLFDVMLATNKANSNDKIVLVSNYTQTLDLFEKLSRKQEY